MFILQLRPVTSRSNSAYARGKSNSTSNNQNQSSSSTASSNQQNSAGVTQSGAPFVPSSVMGFIGVAIALPPPSVHEVRLESDMFVTRLAFDFKIAHCEPK